MSNLACFNIGELAGGFSGRFRECTPTNRETTLRVEVAEQVIVDSDLFEENGHLLFRTLVVEDWMQALQDQRESGPVSPRDVYEP